MQRLASQISRALSKKNVLILGARGKDLHDFLTLYKDDETVNVVGFTGTQIPGISGFPVPVSITGEGYPDGLFYYDESELEVLIEKFDVDECVLSYSDLPYETVMNLGARVNAAGPKFSMTGSKTICLESTKPVISVCAVRTGCMKSSTSQAVTQWGKDMGIKTVAARHPMPYDSDLGKQICQRFANVEDLDFHNCTIEEREEYFPYIEKDLIIYAGIDYEMILREAEEEAALIIWDGGNNDLPFFKPDVSFCVADPLRPGHEVGYYPGSANFIMSDVIIISKCNDATEEDIASVEANAQRLNPDAPVIRASSVKTVDRAEELKGKRVLIVEDGPTLTHGDMDVGAGYVVAKDLGCEIVDPRPYAVGSIKETFEKFSQLEYVIPAMGYGDVQMKELEDSINNVEDVDAVIIGTPIDLAQWINIEKPSHRVGYALDEVAIGQINEILKERILPLIQ